MTEIEFLKTLRRRLAGLPSAEIEEIIADYATHFHEGISGGRSEADIAAALGDPLRLARELRAEASFRRWSTHRTLGNLVFALFAFIALIAVDFIFLLPVVGGLIFFIAITGLVAIGMCLTGLAMIMNLFNWSGGFFAPHALLRILSGVSMVGFGVGGSALLLLLVDLGVRTLARFARLHYSVLQRMEHSV
jgi:uncharacterized membrane protein